jgi:DNA-binding response OmpR family regulator
MKNIWIIDDDEEMTLAIQLMLNMLNYEATGFVSAYQVTDALNAGKIPDLIILDVNMPDVSGMDLLEYLRRKPAWKNLPVVMLSTEAADVTVDKAMELGADGYITKPVTIEELEKALDAAFDKYRKG